MKLPRLVRNWSVLFRAFARYVVPFIVVALLYARLGYAASPGILSDLNYAKTVLGQLGPALSAMLFILAGIFYAIGQMLPPDKKANFHTVAINMIIGAIVVAALSFAATSLANASTHALGNFTIANNTTK